MKLIGSTTSPYVRKVRLLLDEYGYEFVFEKIQALSPEGEKVLSSYGAIKRIPILITKDRNIFDSSIIAEYLLELNGVRLTIDDKLTFRLIDELCDSCITLFQQKLWKIDKQWKDERSVRMLSRVALMLNELNTSVDTLSEFQKDWLFCVLDWINFRSMMEITKNYKNLETFYDHSKQLDKYKNTNPEI